MPRPTIFLPSLCLFALTTLAVPSPAFGFERQWHVGLDGGWGAVGWREAARNGYGGGGHLTYGLTDAFNAMVELSATSHAVGIGQPNLLIASGGAGAAYTLDVMRWVPYFGVLAAGYRFSGADLDSSKYKLGFQFALGLDYAIDRSWAVGAQIRYHTLADEPFSAYYLTTFARVAYSWGW